MIMSVTCFTSTTAFAADSSEDNLYFTQEEFNLLEHTYAPGISTYSTGLILENTLGIGKNGTSLLISGKTVGSSEVKKCGFTKVVIQRKKSTESSWSNYKTYTDLYSDSNYYALSKSVTVEKGYQYRVTARHYAKKSLFSTQKEDSTTGYLTF